MTITEETLEDTAQKGKDKESKAERYVRSEALHFKHWIIDSLLISQSAQNSLNPAIEYLLSTFKNGKFDKKTVHDFFDTFFGSKTISRDPMPELRKHLKDTKLTLSEDERGDIAGFDSYKDFRLLSSGLLNLGKDGISIDTMYHELSGMYPGIFPESIINKSEQLNKILEVAQQFKIERVSAADELSREAVDEIYDDYIKTVEKLEKALEKAERYEKGEALRRERREVEEGEINLSELEELMLKLKRERHRRNVALAKAMLTEEDMGVLNDLLKGRTTLDRITSDKFNLEDIRLVYEASKEYERFLRLVNDKRKKIRQGRYDDAEDILKDAPNGGWRDRTQQFLYMINPLERNFDFIGRRGAASEKLKAAYILPIKKAAADAIRLVNQMNGRVKALNLSRKAAKGNIVSESFAVQFVGEAESAIRQLRNSYKTTRDGKTIEEWQELLDAMWESNPYLDRDKIHKAVDEFRDIYDTLLRMMNEARVRNGYEPIDYRIGYFPHFSPQEPSGLMAMFAYGMGIDVNADKLPGDINGLTHIFKPGIQYFKNANARTGTDTVYDAVEGFSSYIETVADIIYQTDNIQNLRALAGQIRYRDSTEGVKTQEKELREREDLSEEERLAAIDALHSNGRYVLSNFVINLEEYTNLLAGKKSRFDRTAENIFGRKIYGISKSINSNVASNLIAGKLSSYITNFIPLVQSAFGVDTKYMLKAMTQTLKSYFKDDGFSEQSDFLVSRRGTDPLVKSWQKTKAENNSAFAKLTKPVSSAWNSSKAIVEYLMKPMEWIDMFVSESIVRGKYLQNKAKGLSSEDALINADSYTGGLMADRSKGGLPTVFGATNPIIKTFTMFQVEVANQIGFFFNDVPRELKEESAGRIVFAIIKYCIGAWLYNELYEKLTGRRPAFDPLGIFDDTYETLTTETVSDTIFALAKGGTPEINITAESAWSAVKTLSANAVDNLPFVSNLSGGGRIAVSNAYPDIKTLGDAWFSDKATNKKWQTTAKELSKPVFYAAFPGGGGEALNVVKGVTSLAQGGRYTLENDGDRILQYPVDNTKFSDIARATLFGPSATKGGQSWVKSNFDSLSARETVAYENAVQAGGGRNEAYEFIRSLGKVERSEKQKEYQITVKQLKTEKLVSSGFEDEVKWAIYEELIATDSDIEHARLAEEYDINADLFYESLAEYELLDKEYKEDMMNGKTKTYTKLMRATDIVKNTDLAQKQKAVLWQLLVHTNAKNNPYNKRIANEVYDILHPKKTS